MRPKKDPKLIMTLFVKDEVDIIRYNIEFHLAHGVDFIIATDNASIDGTRDILLEYQNKGQLFLIDAPEGSFPQAEYNNKMAQMAMEEYGADVIFHCDADEFWYPKYGDLKTEIWESLEDVMIVELANVLLAARNGNESFPKDAKYAVVNPIQAVDYMKETETKNLYFFRYPPKVMFKTGKGCLLVDHGNHHIMNAAGNFVQRNSKNITIYHFPMRSKERFFQKVIKCGRATEKSKALDTNQNFHIRRWFAAYKTGRLDDEYVHLTVQVDEAKQLKNQGLLVDFSFEHMNDVGLGRDFSPFREIGILERAFQDKTQELQDTKATLLGLTHELQDTKATLLGLTHELGHLKSSKFWKLRTKYMSLKSRLFG